MKTRKLLIPLVLFSLFVLPGCMGGGRPKVVILENDDTVMRIMGEEEIDSEYIDPETNEKVMAKRKHTGRYSLSPNLYKKLLKSALDNQSK